MKTIIILKGEPPLEKQLRGRWDQADLRICADGAADTCLSYGLQPDVVLGDFDSISAQSEIELTETRFIKAPDQEKTDGEKSIEFALSSGATEITIYGALGRRVDHELYTIGLLKRFHQCGADISLVSAMDKMRLITGNTTVHGTPGSRISMMPVFGPVTGVSCYGLVYPLDQATLELGGRCSISNEFESDTAEIRLGSGELLIIVSAD